METLADIGPANSQTTLIRVIRLSKKQQRQIVIALRYFQHDLNDFGPADWLGKPSDIMPSKRIDELCELFENKKTKEK